MQAEVRERWFNSHSSTYLPICTYVCNVVSSCPCLSFPAFPSAPSCPSHTPPPHLTLAGPTPTNISRNSEPEMLRKGTPASPAVAFASKVFPVPGGPDRMAPCKPDDKVRGRVLSGGFTALAPRVDVGCPQCPLHSPRAPHTTCTTWQGDQQVKTHTYALNMQYTCVGGTLELGKHISSIAVRPHNVC